MLAHPSAHFLTQTLNVSGSGIPSIDQEVAVHFRDLRITDDEPPATGGVDELPGLVAGGVLESRAAGLLLDGLGRLARLRDPLHLGLDRRLIARAALKQGLREDHICGRARMPIGEAHVGMAEDADVALAADPAHLDEYVRRLAAVGAGVHAQRAADRAGDAAKKREPV